MPLEYKKTFNPGEHLWPVAVKLSQSDVAQRPNTEIVSCKECGEQFGIQNAIAAIRPMQQVKEQLEQLRLLTTTRRRAGTIQPFVTDEAERFGAETSGHTFLFDPSGRLLFNGGITASRGHSGDNAGESSIVSLINNHTAKIGQTFVFGCSFKTQSQGDLKCSR